MASAIALANKIDFNMLHFSFLVFGLIAAHTGPHPARHALQSPEATEASTAIVAEVIIEASAETIAASLILSTWAVKGRRVAEGIGAAQILPTGTIERPGLGQGCRRRQRQGNKRKCDQLHVYLPCLTGCIALSLRVDAAAKRAGCGHD